MSNSFVTPWTVACQAPLSMGFPRKKYWSRLLFPSPEDLPNPGTEPLTWVLDLILGILWWPCGWNSLFSLLRAQVESLVGELRSQRKMVWSKKRKKERSLPFNYSRTWGLSAIHHSIFSLSHSHQQICKAKVFTFSCCYGSWCGWRNLI